MFAGLLGRRSESLFATDIALGVNGDRDLEIDCINTMFDSFPKLDL